MSYSSRCTIVKKFRLQCWKVLSPRFNFSRHMSSLSYERVDEMIDLGLPKFFVKDPLFCAEKHFLKNVMHSATSWRGSTRLCSPSRRWILISRRRRCETWPL